MAADAVTATVAADAIAVATGVSTVRKQRTLAWPWCPTRGGQILKS